MSQGLCKLSAEVLGQAGQVLLIEGGAGRIVPRRSFGVFTREAFTGAARRADQIERRTRRLLRARGFGQRGHLVCGGRVRNVDDDETRAIEPGANGTIAGQIEHKALRLFLRRCEAGARNAVKESGQVKGDVARGFEDPARARAPNRPVEVRRNPEHKSCEIRVFAGNHPHRLRQGQRRDRGEEGDQRQETPDHAASRLSARMASSSSP